MHYCLFETEIGTCGLAWSDQGVTRLQLPERDRRATERRLLRTAGQAQPAEPPLEVQQAIASLQRYFAGSATEFAHVAVDLSGVDAFRRDIYAALRTVGWGETVSYGAMGERAGYADAARDVGQAMSRNPVPIIIPCHRVLASGNKVGGFSAYGGAATKQRLLEMEGVRLGPESSGQLALPLG
ncbi:MAG: methylated-DNA--[protein]-cysteine S-methyltransferase [Bacteroidota bacterium]